MPVLWVIFFSWLIFRPELFVEAEDITHFSTPRIIEHYGYKAETHKVQTDDGYMLTLHRIPHGRDCPSRSKGVILLHHGLLCSSADWVLMGPGKGLGFILADRCYDIWMGNSRGNFYSKEHTFLDAKSPQFWDFSWHEMGEYDLPALIDYILHIAKRPKLLYIGHSQATTQFFVYNLLHPEHSKKVEAVIALAPIAFLKNSDSFVLQFIAHFQTVLNWGSQAIGLNEFFPTDGLISSIGQKICKESLPLVQKLCSNMLFLTCGFDSEQLNQTALPIILGHTPAGASRKQLLHYAQGIISGEFREFDYGIIQNVLKYGTVKPPRYDLHRITVPVYLVYSQNDWLASIKDVAILKKNLPSLVEEYLIPFKKFNHLDYLWATDADTLVYDFILNRLDRIVKSSDV